MPSPRVRRPRLSYANVASTFALALALTMGGAYAAGQIGSNQIKNNAVKSKHIAPGNVKTSDIHGNAVKSAKVKNGSLKGPDFAARADGVAMAGITVAGSVLQRSFNRLGGQITITHPGAGNYEITVPGANFGAPGDWGKNIVSISNVVFGYCYLNNVDQTILEVQCRDFANVLADVNEFSVAVFKDAVGAPAPRGTGRAGASN
jgi:hypothetical protein